MQKEQQGWLYGILGVCIFSGSLPATRLAVQGFDPVFLTGARAVLAAGIAALCLFILRQKRPVRQDMPALLIVALGCVLGFPLFTALALMYIDAARSLVFIGLLPLATALWSVKGGNDKQTLSFWIFACAGASVVVLYALSQSNASSLLGDMYMLIAIILCGWGYAEGALLTRKIGGWQTISWALLYSLPVMIIITYMTWPSHFSGVQDQAWFGLLYVSLFSMFIGFIFWYRGLALGSIAAISQLQLIQPFLGFILAALFLKEHISGIMLVTSIVVMLCVFGVKKQSAKPKK